MLFPARTGLGAAELVTKRSACPAVATSTVAVAVAAVGLGLGVPEFTLAVLAIIEPGSAAPLTVKTKVNVAVAPLANEGMLQETFPVPPMGGSEQPQPTAAAKEKKVVFAGTVSTRPGATAAAGPLLCTTMV